MPMIVESDTMEQDIVYAPWLLLVLKTSVFLTSFWVNQGQNVANGKQVYALASSISVDERPTIHNSARVVKFKSQLNILCRIS